MPEGLASSEQRDRFPRLTAALLAALSLAGMVITFWRFGHGIGSVSNLSDGRAWGLWISLDVFSGVALAAGGFITAAAVYILRLKRFQPLVRPAILTAFIGYLMVVAALVIDLGQPWRLWHITIYWNPRSPMFELGWCVLLYTLVLALELAPVVFEHLGWRAPLKHLKAIQIPLVIAGVTLSTLHQSSLGSALLLMPTKLHPLWFSPILPILFFLSAVPVGLAMVMVETRLMHRRFGREKLIRLLAGPAKALPWLLGLYLAVKLADLIIEGKTGLMFNQGLFSLLLGLEVLGGLVLPGVLLCLPKARQSLSLMFWAALLVVLGVILNRFNVSLIAMHTHPAYVYFPSLPEITVSVSIFAAGILAYILADRYLKLPLHAAD